MTDAAFRAVRITRRRLLKGVGTLAVVGVAGCASTPKREVKKERIALVLGGGAARGFAHIGVIKVLEAQGIAP
ncbi:MAG: twin-arginine translocation signal domain-containing protein, partial [Burkholderiaceae bacterium]